MIEIGYFERKSFGVRAVRITEENMEGVAAWCNGAVVTTNKQVGGKNVEVRSVQLTVMINKNRQLASAHVGDWVTHNKTWKIYTDAAFTWVFQPTDQMKFVKVRALVAEAMNKQDAATYHDDQKSVVSVADEISNKILELL